MYNALKTQLSELLGITKDALHIHIGLAIFLVAALVFRRSLSSWVPWLCLLAFEIANELMDAFHLHGGPFSIEIGDSLKDMLNTMFWPTMLLLGLRWHHHRNGKRHTNSSTPRATTERTP